MLKKGFQTKHKNVYELYILSKYFRTICEDDQEVKDKLIKFSEKYIEHFNIDEWYKIINKAVSASKKGKLITDKIVNITLNELNVIQELESLNEQKVAFTLLVLYKFYDYKKFEVSIEDLYRLCKLNINSKTKLKVLQSLTSKELIDITMGGKRWVNFTDKKSDPAITIKDFDDYIYEYLRYIGEDGLSECEVCNKAIKVRGRNHKMCKGCSDTNRQMQNKEKSLKYYHKNKQK